MNQPFPTDDEALEKLLAHPDSPLPDDGFSLRVLAALPAPQPRRSRVSAFNLQRMLLCTLGGLVGVWVTWNSSWSSFDASAVTTHLGRMWSLLVSVSTDPGWMTVGAIAVCSIVYAFLSDGRRSIFDR